MLLSMINDFCVINKTYKHVIESDKIIRCTYNKNRKTVDKEGKKCHICLKYHLVIESSMSCDENKCFGLGLFFIFSIFLFGIHSKFYLYIRREEPREKKRNS
jgi:hypothetical protein